MKKHPPECRHVPAPAQNPLSLGRARLDGRLGEPIWIVSLDGGRYSKVTPSDYFFSVTAGDTFDSRSASLSDAQADQAAGGIRGHGLQAGVVGLLPGVSPVTTASRPEFVLALSVAW